MILKCTQCSTVFEIDGSLDDPDSYECPFCFRAGAKEKVADEPKLIKPKPKRGWGAYWERKKLEDGIEKG